MKRFAAAAAVLLAGCVSLLPERAAQSYYRLEDAAQAAAALASATRAGPSALIAPVPTDSVGNSFGLAYTRAAGERAFYQYAQWTDRPTFRVAQLLLDRLAARGAFSSVARLGSGVAGDVLINVIVTDAVHDLTSGGAGVGRVEAMIEVIDRQPRALLGRRHFAFAAPAAAANAAGGAAAI
ncbi:MAG TPA: ABC-type transport auxiliary lipoprotein family protein, partial [Burkholderiaceae bacterium]|nr:ABC-type transport auxiliary lipoprotein family protein [Burkholderiaceae bacterium]